MKADEGRSVPIDRFEFRSAHAEAAAFVVRFSVRVSAYPAIVAHHH